MRVYRASALGGCMKAQIADQLEYKRIESTVMESVFAEGNLHEGAVIDFLGGVTDQQLEVVLELSPAFDVVGHIDGIYNGHLLEIKSMGKDVFKAWKSKGWSMGGLMDRYKWQVSAYMLATGLPLHFIAKCRDNGELDHYVTDEPFVGREEILRRVLTMEAYVRKGELPGTCDAAQFPCPFFYLHDEDLETWVEDDTLDSLADMYEEERRAVKIAKGRQDEARKALEAGLAGREKVTTEHAKVTVYQTKRRTLDVDKMKAELGDEAIEPYYYEKLGKGLRVTIKEKDDESGGDSEREEPDTESERGTGDVTSSPEPHGDSPSKG